MGKNSQSRRLEKKRIKIKKVNKKNTGAIHESNESLPQYTELSNPFSALSNAEREGVILGIRNKAKKELPVNISQLQRLFEVYDPLDILSHAAFYNLAIGVNDDGVSSSDYQSKITQSHVELLQAISLTTTPSSEVYKVIRPDVHHDIYNNILSMSENYHLSRYNEDIIYALPQEKAISQIQESLRLHTQHVRNWGYHSQVINLTQEIYKPFDEIMDEKLGFSCTFAAELFLSIMDNLQDNINIRYAKVRELRKTSNTKKMIGKYYDIADTPENLRFDPTLMVQQLGVSHKNLFFFLLSHFDLSLSKIYKLPLDKLMGKLSCGKGKILKAINYFSLETRSLTDNNVDYFFLDNPVWSKPIIKKGDDYYCFMPQLLFSFSLKIFDEMVEGVDKKRLHDRRAKYLEEKIEEIVGRRFPASQIYTGIKWVYKETQYETDLIAIIDSLILIIEAKSHSITAPALRGAPKSIKKHLEDILITPSEQSRRFEMALRSDIDAISKGENPTMELPFELDKIKKIFRISVSLEDFATLQSNLRQFEETEWLPEGFVSCPTMNLADFETIFDYLDHPIEILHYVQRREYVERLYRVLGDEIDYLGLYISNLLTFNEMDSNKETFISISGMSSEVDKYYMSQDIGIEREKKRPAIPAYFRGVLEKLERNATPRWTEIGLKLINIPLMDMRKIESSIRDLKRIVQLNRASKERKNNTFIYTPPKICATALSVTIFTKDNYEQRRLMLQEAASQALENEGVYNCLTIGINIDEKDEPYHIIGIYGEHL